MSVKFPGSGQSQSLSPSLGLLIQSDRVYVTMDPWFLSVGDNLRTPQELRARDMGALMYACTIAIMVRD